MVGPPGSSYENVWGGIGHLIQRVHAEGCVVHGWPDLSRVAIQCPVIRGPVVNLGDRKRNCTGFSFPGGDVCLHKHGRWAYRVYSTWPPGSSVLQAGSAGPPGGSRRGPSRRRFVEMAAQGDGFARPSRRAAQTWIDDRSAGGRSAQVVNPAVPATGNRTLGRTDEWSPEQTPGGTSSHARQGE